MSTLYGREGRGGWGAHGDRRAELSAMRRQRRQRRAAACLRARRVRVHEKAVHQRHRQPALGAIPIIGTIPVRSREARERPRAVFKQRRVAREAPQRAAQLRPKVIRVRARARARAAPRLRGARGQPRVACQRAQACQRCATGHPRAPVSPQRR